MALLALSLCGCATVDKTTRKIARDLNPAKGSLKIRMALLPIADKASLETGVLKPDSKNR